MESMHIREVTLTVSFICILTLYAIDGQHNALYCTVICACTFVALFCVFAACPVPLT